MDPNFAITGHGIHFFRLTRDVSMKNFWSDLGRNPADLDLLLDLGAVYLNSSRLQSDAILKPNDILRIHTEPKRYALPANDNIVVYESDLFLVIDKPPGLPVHPTLDNQTENCLTWLARQRGTPLFVTNRLDVGTEGLITFAKSERAQRIFMKQVQDGRLEKMYSAVSEKPVSVGRLEHWMKPSPYPPKILSATAEPTWKNCLSEVLETRVCGSWTESLLRLVTGRTHQLRAQLSAMGSPILGDRLYNSKFSFRSSQSWALRSMVLGFRDEDRHIRLELPRWSLSEIKSRLPDG